MLSKRLSGLVPYVPGEQPRDQEYIKLNTNESPFPPSLHVIEAVNAEASRLNLYPDPSADRLISALAENFGVEKNRVFAANGSDEILAFIFMGFCDNETPCYFPDITYGFYEVYKNLCCLPGEKIPLKEDMTIDPRDYFDKDGVVIIANPNAPTGLCLGIDEVESIVKNNKNLVVIDEAYVDFGGQSALPLLKKYSNLAVVGTFSKSRNLAGGRVGYMLSSPEVIRDINTVKFSFNPYNINRLSMAAAEAALKDRQYFEECQKKIIENREFFTAELERMGLFYLKSSANFVFAKVPDAAGVMGRLKSRGILVRYFDGPRVSDYLRITIGTKQQMERLAVATGKLSSKYPAEKLQKRCCSKGAAGAGNTYPAKKTSVRPIRPKT